MSSEEIVYADKKYRKKFLIAFIIIAIITAVFLHYTNEYIDHLSSEQSLEVEFKSIEEMMSFIELLRGAIAIVFTIIGIYWISTGYKTLKYNRFPPPGMKVLRDTKIKKGSNAKVMAYGLFIGAIFLITLPNLTFWYMHKVFDNAKSTLHEVSELREKHE